MPLIVTIDGPAGSGKSTVAKKLAKRLGLIHLNSGALFRAVGLAAEAVGVELSSDKAVSSVAATITFEFSLAEDGATRFKVTAPSVGEKNIEKEVGTEHAGDLASRVAVLPGVRELILQVQRRLGATNGLVLEGRDSGSVIFPNAEFKFFLDAPSHVRAERRFSELKDKLGKETTLADVHEELLKRDNRDSTRELAPQIVPEGAEVVDTTPYSVGEVVELLYRRVMAT